MRNGLGRLAAMVATCTLTDVASAQYSSKGNFSAGYHSDRSNYVSEPAVFPQDTPIGEKLTITGIVGLAFTLGAFYAGKRIIGYNNRPARKPRFR